MSCYIFDTKMEDCETLRSPEGEETGNSRQDIFYPPNPSSVCSLFFKKPFKSHMGKEALQGAFDSFGFGEYNEIIEKTQPFIEYCC